MVTPQQALFCWYPCVNYWLNLQIWVWGYILGLRLNFYEFKMQVFWKMGNQCAYDTLIYSSWYIDNCEVESSGNIDATETIFAQVLVFIAVAFFP